MDEHVRELIENEQRKHHWEQNKARYIGVLCDRQGIEMQNVTVLRGLGLTTRKETGFRCQVPGCKRFFGTSGYADLTNDKTVQLFENLLNGPTCPQFPALPMYLQSSPSGLVRWVCAQCNEERPAANPDRLKVSHKG